MEAVLDFPGDTFAAVDLASVLGVNRDTVTEAFRKGHIANSALSLRNPSYADGKYKRRFASKSTVIEWLWDSQVGERTMIRKVLQERAPHVLETLDARDAERALNNSKAPQRRTYTQKHASPFPMPEQPELSLF